MSASPNGISYEIIWAQPRIPPSSAQRLLEAQPPRTTPYTLSETIASTYRIPMFRLAA